ncbi:MULTISPECIES: SDR family oxidoreductase [unclassified Pseudonocardia]|jgi:NAD(P)-dependent dehydrogenase (short-subunit alcohol dehydrogenase family)|uniref:SDR family oxidoreductase n=1 Tax=unclassified Pseudonocardia TaxID=2619320 RepID=UPI00095AAB30|nr:MULTISPECIES: SDR family oxidoreductase [unclassified Pseudonocardia]MBN9098634.1 SDR family oxidoreductase [Pseudonocardia sp.]OJY52039.1 MAG: hypothetical protein BGP03_08335 [Pseudonocardia sp. 73-21]
MSAPPAFDPSRPTPPGTAPPSAPAPTPAGTRATTTPWSSPEGRAQTAAAELGARWLVADLADPEAAGRFVAVTSLGVRRLGGPGQFGRVVAFLCSAHADYVTGAALPVDGGAYQALL